MTFGVLAFLPMATLKICRLKSLVPLGPRVHRRTGVRLNSVLPALGCRRRAFCFGSRVTMPLLGAGATSGAMTVNGSTVAGETLPAASICCTPNV